MINHEKRVAFVHAPKTGGSSVSAALGGKIGWLGKDQHETSGELLAACPEARAYRWLGVVRNPWDRVVSWYWYKSGGKVPFADFLLGMTRGNHPLPPLARYYEHATRAAQMWGPGGFDLTLLRHESLGADFSAWLVRTGVPARPLERHKGGYRKSPRDYRAMYPAPWMRTYVAREYAADIAAFGYTFNDPDLHPTNFAG